MLNGVNLTSNFAITEASQRYVLRVHCDTLHINSRNYAHGVISFCSGYMIKHFLITSFYILVFVWILKIFIKKRDAVFALAFAKIKKKK